jgi:AsmA family
MSRKKILLIVLLIPVVLVVVAWAFLDHFAKKAVEVGGEQAMGVPTSLDGISLRPFVGYGSVEGLEISNPKGFETPYFMRLTEGKASMDISSVLTDTVVVRSIELDGLKAHLEKSKDGSNYEVILANMKKGEEEEGAPGEEEPGKKFLVERITVTNIDVRADLAVVGEKLSSVDFRIDEIVLENVGSGSDSGVIMSELMGTIVKAVLVAIVEQGARVLPEVMVKGLGAGLKGVGKVGFKVTVRAGGKTLEVLGGAGKAVGGAIKGIFGGGGDDDK